MKTNINGLNLDIKSVGSKKYIEAKLENDSDVKEFEINMLQNNPSLAFIKVELRQINNEKSLFFDVTYKVTLKEYISSYKLNQREFIEMVKNILLTLNITSEYMLNKNKIVFTPDMLFVDEISKIPYLVFMPLNDKVTDDIESDFFKMCKEILSKLQKCKDLSPIEKKIITTLGKNSSISNLLELLEEHNLSMKAQKDEVKEDEEDEEEEVILEEKPKKKEFKEEKFKPAIKERTKFPEYKSIIEEDTDNYDELEEDGEEDEDDDLMYEDYKHDQKYYGKEKNDNTNKLLILQMIIVLLIGSLVLLLSMDDKQFFMMMVAVIGFDVLFTVLVLMMSAKGKKKKR